MTPESTIDEFDNAEPQDGPDDIDEDETGPNETTDDEESDS